MSREAVDRFASSARRYVAFVEDPFSGTLAARAREAQARMLELVAAVGGLELAEFDTDANEPDALRPSRWIGFGDFELYWDVFDPYEESEPIARSLTDDLLGVHRDVSSGLAAYAAGDFERAEWTWRFLFDAHWGHHAVGAIRALHAMQGRVG